MKGFCLPKPWITKVKTKMYFLCLSSLSAPSSPAWWGQTVWPWSKVKVSLESLVNDLSCSQSGKMAWDSSLGLKSNQTQKWSELPSTKSWKNPNFLLWVFLGCSEMSIILAIFYMLIIWTRTNVVIDSESPIHSAEFNKKLE